VEGAVACAAGIQRTGIDDRRVWTSRATAHNRDGVKSCRDVEITGGRRVLLCSVGQREVIGGRGLEFNSNGVGVYVSVCGKYCVAQTAIVRGNCAGAGAGMSSVLSTSNVVTNGGEAAPGAKFKNAATRRIARVNVVHVIFLFMVCSRVIGVWQYGGFNGLNRFDCYSPMFGKMRSKLWG
jgi:hypothetical protein